MRTLYVSIFIILQTGYLFSQNNHQLLLDSNYRTVPDFGFNGNTIRGPSWTDSIFNDSVSTMFPKVIRYPGGVIANFLDWETGWFLSQDVLDTAIIDTVYTMNTGWYFLDTLDMRPIVFQQALDQIQAKGVYVMNMMSSSVSKQSQALRDAINDGVSINKIELGNEINRGDTFQIMKYPTAGDYARACNDYIDSIKVINPNAKIAVVGGNRAPDSSRAGHWNDSIYSIVNSLDALVWHPYIYLNDKDTSFTIKQVLAYPFYRIPLIEKWRGFSDTILELQDYKIWITEYNLFDKTYDLRYVNTWAHVLILAGMNNLFLHNDLVEMSLLHNVGGIFQNFDALDTQDNFRKRSTGVFAQIFYKSMFNTTYAKSIITSNNFKDSVEYENNNGIINKVVFPKLFGWEFKNYSTSSLFLVNISKDTLFISLPSNYSVDLYWEKWVSDSLFAKIDYANIYMHSDTGKINILIPPYSINIANSILCTNYSYYQDIYLCQDDSLEIGNNIYFSDGNYIDSLTNISGCDSILITNLNIYPEFSGSIIQYGDTIFAQLDGTNLASSYLWNTLDTNSSIVPNQNGIYWVIMEDDNNCVLDTVFYNFVSVYHNEFSDLNKQKDIIKITDIFGRISKHKENTILFYIFNDGSVEKRIVID